MTGAMKRVCGSVTEVHFLLPGLLKCPQRQVLLFPFSVHPRKRIALWHPAQDTDDRDMQAGILQEVDQSQQ